MPKEMRKRIEGYLERLAKRHLAQRGYRILPPNFIGVVVSGWGDATVRKIPPGYSHVEVDFPVGMPISVIALSCSIVNFIDKEPK